MSAFAGGHSAKDAASERRAEQQREAAAAAVEERAQTQQATRSNAQQFNSSPLEAGAREKWAGRADDPPSRGTVQSVYQGAQAQQGNAAGGQQFSQQPAPYSFTTDATTSHGNQYYQDQAAVLVNQAAQQRAQQQREGVSRVQQLSGSLQNQQQQIQNSFNNLASQLVQPSKQNGNSGNSQGQPAAIWDSNRQEYRSPDGGPPPVITYRNPDGTVNYSGIPVEAVDPSAQIDVHYQRGNPGPLPTEPVTALQLGSFVESPADNGTDPNHAPTSGPTQNLSQFLDEPVHGEAEFKSNTGFGGLRLSDLNSNDQSETAPRVAAPMTDEEWRKASVSYLQDYQNKLQAADILRSGAADLQSAIQQGQNDATLSQVGALGKLAGGLSDIAMETPPFAEFKPGYQALKASADVLNAQNDSFEKLVGTSKVAVSADKSSAFGGDQLGLGGLAKLNAAADGMINLAKGNYVEAAGNVGTITGNGALTAQAKIANGALKVYAGAQGVAQGNQIKQDIASYGQGVQASLNNRADQIQAAAAALQAQQDSILLPPQQ